MTIPYFADGTRVHWIGWLPAPNQITIPLADDRDVNFDDFGECDFRCDDAHPDGTTARSRGTPEWL